MDEISLTKEEANEKTIIQSLEEDGVCVIESFLDEQTIGDVRSEFQQIYEDSEYDFGRGPDGGHTESLNLHYDRFDGSAFPSLEDLVSISLFERVAKAYFAENDVIYPSNLWFARSHGTPDSPTGEPADGPPYAYHIDQQNKLKFFFYLTDVGARDGPTHFIPEYHREYKEHRRKWIEKHDRAPGNFDNLIWHYHVAGTAKEKEIPVVADAGTLLIFDTDVPHRAGPLEEGHTRDILRIDTLSPSHSGVPAPEPRTSPHPLVRGIRNPTLAARALVRKVTN